MTVPTIPRRLWSADEDQRVRELLTGGASYTAIAARLGRAKGSVGKRIAHLGLVGVSPHSRPQHRGPRTDSEGSPPRTRSGAYRIWSEGEHAELARLVALGVPERDIATALGRSAAGVHSRRMQKGLDYPDPEAVPRKGQGPGEAAPAWRPLDPAGDLWRLWDAANRRLRAQLESSL